MPAKPVFTEDQYEILQAAAKRVWRTKFQAEDKTQKDMALALGVSQQSVSNLLKGTYRPGLKVATEIATLDGKELEDLIGDFAQPTMTATPAHGQAGGSFTNLDICIQFHSSTKHWSSWTIAAARAGFFGNADFAAPEWAGKLDLLEKALERTRGKGA